MPKAEIVKCYDPHDVHELDDLRQHGILWAINVHVFHPRGFSLAFEVNHIDGGTDGWVLLGDGTEPWYMPPEIGDEPFLAFEALLDAHRRTDAVQPDA